ncbi:hypothetical protein ALC53_13082, partial [Atta colombica]
SNCGKINLLISLLESPYGMRFENVYVYSKSLQKPKYRYLENLFVPIEEIFCLCQMYVCCCCWQYEIVIDKDSVLMNERYKKGFNEFAIP